ncbi:DNA-methyltransferase [Moorella sp. Hama-1]|uniref:DNA-methyltransferase n=1 Tax=Moorella sp. Hama-1 TaxID=2138101 RepID=UPI000D642ADF|nr:site-specific DNA-methyltransferase [Moorella sp. Hama-1]MDN5361397.1 hypothetical protein [Moorella sp. (in: firmicutes)]BCV22132.1 methyltransferase [Moorella sp. Hama-1]
MTILLGDCLSKMAGIESATIDLVYLDPPFFSQKNHRLKPRDNSKEYTYEDVWGSLEAYLSFMKECLIQCRRVLKNTGSIFLHCDRSASHHLRLLLDETFGTDMFQSEIIWAYRRWSSKKKGLLNSHQTIFFYSKTKDFKFNTIYTDYSPTTNIDQILQERERDINGKSVYKRDEYGNIIIGKEKKGVPLSDVWYIPYLNPKAKERVGYPTQKPVLLLEQIIRIASDENDLILDPFCGSGTTLIAAKLLNRRFIGIDNSVEAVNLTKHRLYNPIISRSAYIEKGADSYIEKSSMELEILKSINAIPVQRNSGIDGFLKKLYHGKPISIRFQKEHEPLQEAKNRLITASKAKECGLMILFRTNLLDQSTFMSAQKELDQNLLVIDSYDLIIRNWIKNKSKEHPNNRLCPRAAVKY